MRTAPRLVVLAGVAWTAAVSSQTPQARRTVADGIYTDAQATRGAASYELACARCHRTDLGGADGPALKDERFGRVFAGKPLRGFYERITATMPRPAPGSLAEGVYLDIVAHLLRENGFPAGGDELTSEGMDGVEVLPTRQQPPPAVGDFSYVEVSGCLARGRDGGWQLEQATDPVAVRPTLSAPPPASMAVPRSGQSTLLDGGPGRHDRTIHLIDAVAHDTDRHRGHLLKVRGILVRHSGQQRLTMSAIESLAPTCP